MQILFLTPNFENYTASQYQSNTIKYIKKHSDVILWGPGYNNFDQNLSLQQVVEKFNLSRDDAICVGHGWLSDSPFDKKQKNNNYKRYSWMGEKNINLNLNVLEYCKEYNFEEFKGKKICILNKEYVLLEEKLDFIKKSKFDFVLCLNPHYKNYEKLTNTEFKFWPNAVDHELYLNKSKEKKYDFCFSGLISNPYVSSIFSDKNKYLLRLRVLNEIFFSLGAFKIARRKNYSMYNIFWNTFTGNKYFDKILKILCKYKYLNNSEYSKLIRSSRVVLNILGPSDLIGPRYFESMISKSVCLCQESSLYKEIFTPMKHYVPFKEDLSDFKEKLHFCISDSEEVNKIKENAYNLILNNHTYDRRAQDMIAWISNIKK